MDPPSRKDLASGVAIALIVMLTLVPVSFFHEAPGPADQWLSFEPSLPDFLVNVFLFMGLGVVTGFRKRTLTAAILLGAALSLSIETLQLAIATRTTSPWDLLANTLGSAVGHQLSVHRNRWLDPPVPSAARLCLGAALVTACVFAGSGLLLVPSIPAGQLFVHAPPQFETGPRYAGTIEAVLLDGAALARNALPNSEAVANALAAENFELRIRGIGAASSAEVVPLFLISSEPGEQTLLLISLQADDLLIEFRTLGHAFFIESPRWRAAGLGSTLEAGRVFEIEVARRNQRLCLRVEERSRCDLAPTVAEAWTLFLPQVEWMWGRAAWITAIWFGGPFLLIGFWARRRVVGSVAFGLLAVVVIAAPSFTSLRPLEPGQLLAGVLGCVVGWALRYRVRRRADSH